MDTTQALHVLSALANGTHPSTGEIFPAESPYQTPDVIRALYLAVRSLEQGAKANTASPAKPATRSVPVTNAGKPWNAEEDKKLLAGFDGGKSLAELAQAHGRTQNGVRARLEKHGRLEPSEVSRWPVNGLRLQSPR